MSDSSIKLVRDWEAIYKKGQLTLWILLSLHDSPKRIGEIKAFIEVATNGQFSVDDQSVYRALRRYYDTEFVDFTFLSNPNGPDWKVYSLTPLGQSVLRRFSQRNFISVLYKPEIQSLIERSAE